METLPPLDAHAHLAPGRTSSELAGTGAVLAMTLSLDEAALTVDRREPHIVWGVGCHPRDLQAQTIVRETGTWELFPEAFAPALAEA